MPLTSDPATSDPATTDAKRAFTVYPCVDIQRGRAVRLTEGDPERETVYFEDPRAAARHWTSLGARDLHVVDIDATTGTGDNRELIRELAAEAAAAGVRVEIGGGVRSAETAKAWLALLDRVILGTVAITRPELVSELLEAFGPERVAVSVDARGGLVALRGWQETSAVPALELAGQMAERGVRHLIYTDIDRDGTLQGVNPEPVRAMRGAFPYTLVAGGGVATEADLRLYRELGLDGAIVGRALYEGTVSYPGAA